MAKKYKRPNTLQEAALRVVEQQALRRERLERALLEILTDDTSGEQEEGSTKSASSARNKRGSPKAGNTTYPMKPETLTIPSEKEKMVSGTYSPPQEYRVKKHKPGPQTPSRSTTKPPK